MGIMNYPSPTNPEEALVLALSLAITAPNDENARECSDIAQSIAATLDAEVIARCRDRASIISKKS